jgi:hypothetical protein
MTSIKGYRVTKDGKLVKNQPKQSVSRKIAARKSKKYVSRAKADHHGNSNS